MKLHILDILDLYTVNDLLPCGLNNDLPAPPHCQDYIAASADSQEFPDAAAPLICSRRHRRRCTISPQTAISLFQFQPLLQKNHFQ